jgi:hypothetical protein
VDSSRQDAVKHLSGSRLSPELLPYGGSAVKSGELTLRLATEETDVRERQGHYLMAIVCRRSSVSTSFMLAALRVLHVDISIPLGTGSLDRAKAICASEFACVGSVVLSAYILESWFLDLFRGRVGRSSGGEGRLGYGASNLSGQVGRGR